MVSQVRRGCLLLDEIDLLLHPLKSELNWPLGEREPLDFAKTELGSGLRWKLPIELIDVLIRCSTPRTEAAAIAAASAGATSAASPPNEAAYVGRGVGAVMGAVLEGLREALAAGYAAQAVQRAPLLVLLSRGFYDEQLLPWLARWGALWLEQIGFPEGERERLLVRYLATPRATVSQQTATILHSNTWLLELQRTLSVDQLKLLNLARDWLHELLPHALSRRR